jgi:regulator of protease activity HflC (stomatin/prohibitin superfamily)
MAFRFVRCIRLVPQRKAYIVERLGKYYQTLGPGFHILVPIIDRVAYIQDLREEAIEVPPQECFTKDNVRIEVDGIVYISVVDPVNASYGITDYRFAAVQLAQTTTRSVVGTLELDRTFEEREEVNSRVVGVLSEVAEAWGIKVHRYEVKNIVPPPTVRDAMERQMAAERDRRAVLASAEGQATARINESEGTMREMINRSEGEKQRRINEAQGRAEEILAVARATADSIEKIGYALSQPGGVDATNLRLKQQLVDQLGRLAQGKTNVLLPSDLTAMDEILGTVEIVKNGANGAVHKDRTIPSRPAT